jgi:ribosomal protein L33
MTTTDNVYEHVAYVDMKSVKTQNRRWLLKRFCPFVRVVSDKTFLLFARHAHFFCNVFSDCFFHCLNSIY